MPAIDYHHTFKALDSLLDALRPLWQLVAFECDHLPWQQSFPQLAQKVWQLDDAEIDNLDASQQQLVDTLLPSLISDLKHSQRPVADELISWLSLLVITSATRAINNDNVQWLTADKSQHNDPKNDDLIKSPQPKNHSGNDDLSHFNVHIKGRKWQQITAFAEQVDPQHHPQLPRLPILEWCAGKGHLGRLVAKQQAVVVTSLEWQTSLCAQGQIFAEQWQIPQTFICADAFAPIDASKPLLLIDQHAIALHACGDLHTRLLKLAASAGTRVISISPCCYHLIEHEHYQPLSALAKASALKLSKHDLQLPLQQSVIAGTKKRLLRNQEVSWRLGFDSLQRDIRGVEAYLPVPTIKKSQLSGSFSDFCLWAANQKHLFISSEINLSHYLHRGIERQRLTKRIDLVAHLFRRALEHWLLLDRVCFLQEQGYAVTLTEFCANSVTPRNALIQAIKTN
ncbi:methyltransferase [Shewanella livingstonensis]|uniref:Methyltransferase n=1 Tax=Shewanella livingstonensis TaxID=150120 RepID=A0A3G8LW68_9GAMM|nr:methyltransferase [Shewanella livingstonensis]AZG73861.1 methyltransferase [Shewanella livingstonensis]